MWVYLIAAFLALLVFCYRYITKDYGYWRSQGFAETPGSFPFGSKEMKDMFMGRENFFTAMDRIFQDNKDKGLCGYYLFADKVVVITDLDVAKHVMIKDFDYFTDRRDMLADESSYSNRVFNEMLTSLKGDKWKSVRGLLSPVFTSGKLKSMAPMLTKVNYLNLKLNNGLLNLSTFFRLGRTWSSIWSPMPKKVMTSMPNT